MKSLYLGQMKTRAVVGILGSVYLAVVVSGSPATTPKPQTDDVRAESRYPIEGVVRVGVDMVAKTGWETRES